MISIKSTQKFVYVFFFFFKLNSVLIVQICLVSFLPSSFIISFICLIIHLVCNNGKKQSKKTDCNRLKFHYLESQISSVLQICNNFQLNILSLCLSLGQQLHRSHEAHINAQTLSRVDHKSFQN